MVVMKLQRAERYETPPGQVTIMHAASPKPEHLELLAEEEAALVQLARYNPELFAPLYERYFDRVYAYCLRRTANAQEAEDLCSQIFTKALTGLDTFRDGAFAPWLFGIARNTLIDHYRRQKIQLSLDDAERYSDEALEIDEEAPDDARIVAALLAELNDEQRDLIAMSVEAELTSDEIGQMVGKSAGAVRVQLHRTFKQLRKHYQKLTGER